MAAGSKRMNVALVGHRSSGKTTLAEQVLAACRALRSAGSVEEGTSLLDHLDEERRRRLSLQTGFGWVECGEVTLNLLDTPGRMASAYERSLAIAVADVVVVVVDCSERVAVGAEVALQEATRAGKPTLIFLNKVDRPHQMSEVLEGLRESSEKPVAPLEVVLAEQGRCTAIGDLITRKTVPFLADHPFPEGLQHWHTNAFEQLAEAVALADDELLEDYLEYLELSEDQLVSGLRKALAHGRLVPVLHGSAVHGFGIDRLLAFLTEMAPIVGESPGPLAHDYDGTPERIGPEHEGGFIAQLVATQIDTDGNPYQVLRVWSGLAPLNKEWANPQTGAKAKVRKLYALRGPRRSAAKFLGAGALIATWDVLPGRPGDTFTHANRWVVEPPAPPPPMMSWSVRAELAKDHDRLPACLERLLQLDGGLQAQADPATGEWVVAGGGEAQLEWAVERLTMLGMPVSTALPTIPYREMPAGIVRNVEGIHKLADGHGLPVEYGCCNLDVEPRPDEGIDFEDACQDLEELPRKFRPAIDEGVRLALRHGPLAGYPVLGAHVRLIAGGYDILQSTEDHFRLAGEIATRRALEEAGTKLLEPWWSVDVYMPSSEVGSVIAELSGRRGRVVGLDVIGHETRVCAHVPFRELRTFGPRLEAVCAGRGRFFSEPSHYELAPDNVLREAIDTSPFLRAG